MSKLRFDVGKRTVRSVIGSRGGGIEIHLNGLNGGKYNGLKMTAYQNYLGGGMLGSIANDCQVENWRDDEYLVRVADRLCRHYFSLLVNDEYTEEEYLNFQKRSVSAY